MQRPNVIQRIIFYWIFKFDLYLNFRDRSGRK